MHSSSPVVSDAKRQTPNAKRVLGSGRLRVTLVDGASAALAMEAHAPLKLLVPCPRGPTVWAFAATFGGGLVAGDRIAMEVMVDTGATAAIGTQASTKIYRCETGVAAEQSLVARVASGLSM